MSDTILKHLQTNPLFKDLNTQDLENIQASLEQKSVKAGEIVIRQGGDSDGFYLITKGQFEITREENNKPQTLNLLYPPEFFGDVPLMYKEPSGATVRALRSSEVLRIPPNKFYDLLDDYPVIEKRMDEFGRKIENRSLKTFPGKREGEIIIYHERRHWFALARQLGSVVAFLLLWAVGMLGAYMLFQSNENAQGQVVLVGLTLLTIPFLRALWVWADWLNDYYIVTNRRVIHIEKVIGLMSKRFEVPISNIQNVNVTSPTPVSEILGYSHVKMPTAGKGTLDLDYVPQANWLQERVLGELNQFKTSLAQFQDEKKRAKVREIFGPSASGGKGKAKSKKDAPNPPTPLWVTFSTRVQKVLTYFRPQMREETKNSITWRKHWLVLLTEIFPTLLSTLFFVALILTAEIWLLDSGLTVTMRTIELIGGLIILVHFLRLAWLYDDWRNDLYILKENEILDEDKKPFGFNKDVRRAPLDTIQDVRAIQSNPLMVIFGVGHVNIQTAGEGKGGLFTFHWVKDPQQVQSDIFEYIQLRKQKQQASQAAAINQELIELLRIYEEERRKIYPVAQAIPVT